MLFPYPPSPKNVDASITNPSDSFRKEVLCVVRLIVRFIFTYLSLLLGAIGLVIACAMVGYWIVTTIKNLWGLVLGIGLIGLGIMVLYFLLKFAFKSKSIDRSGMIEITENDQPMLFAFIRKLAGETQTPLPKRVYLSPDVNAFVFYDSSFWSMFLPIRKNLNIGLGLVNCVNVSEFKAVIAHEFGHFSQKSMKLGSYVYTVNHIIHDMLFDNDDYEVTLERFGNAHAVFRFFADLTNGIVGGIKKILQSLYYTINERNMALSRQMEFHADAVAASVSGSSPLSSVLYRLDVADTCYRTLLSEYDGLIKENRKAVNVYQHHTAMMENFASIHGLTFEYNLVKVNADTFKKYQQNRVIITDQWASHPSSQDREKRLCDLGIKSDLVTESAWALFTHAEELQKEVTARLYADASFQGTPQLVDNDGFRSFLTEQTKKYSLHKDFKGFYDGRDISPFPLEDISLQATAAQNISDILTEDVLNLPFLVNGLTAEIEILESLPYQSPTVKSFDFEGKKYATTEAPTVIQMLQTELKTARSLLEQADKEMFLLFYKKSAQTGREQEAKAMYERLFSLNEDSMAKLTKLGSMMEEAGQLFQQRVTHEKASAVTNSMNRNGDEVKSMMAKMLEDESYASHYAENEKQTIVTFINNKRDYFSPASGLDGEVIVMYMTALQLYGNIISERNFAQKKKILELQHSVIQGETERLAKII